MAAGAAVFAYSSVPTAKRYPSSSFEFDIAF